MTKDELQDDDRVLMRLYAPLPRRAFATATLAGLGALLLWVAVAQPGTGAVLRVALLAGGAAGLWLAVRLWQATGVALELTPLALREAGGGRVLASLADVRAVNSGTFALKPSNGFLLVTRDPAPLAWAPGLWWRIGRRVGVGGVTGRIEARVMAEMLTATLAERRR